MNLVSLKDLQENLATFDKNIFKIPLVLQYNKRDPAEQDITLLSIETLEKDLNRQLKVPYFEASALAGENVVATLKKVITLTVASLQDKLEL